MSKAVVDIPTRQFIGEQREHLLCTTNIDFVFSEIILFVLIISFSLEKKSSFISGASLADEVKCDRTCVDHHFILVYLCRSFVLTVVIVVVVVLT
jgi:hypothetical protein